MKRTCYRCMKDFDPKQEDPTTNFELDLNWSTVCRACGRKFYFIDMNGYLCKECTNKIIGCLYELHAKENQNA